MKIKQRLGFSDYDDEKQKKDFKNKNFSIGFKDMVASCLDQDPSKRPTGQLLEHSFFPNCEGLGFLFKNVSDGLPHAEERFKETKDLHYGTSSQITAGTDIEEEEEGTTSAAPVEQRISGWKFNEDGFVLDPVIDNESEDDQVVKVVRFRGETIIPKLDIEFSKSSGDLEGLVGDHTGLNMSGVQGIIEGLVALKKTLDEQRKRLVSFLKMNRLNSQVHHSSC
jgi:serine/threonine-protein kinase OSR1/STK39